jgi:hypothetical protein
MCVYLRRAISVDHVNGALIWNFRLDRERGRGDGVEKRQRNREIKFSSSFQASISLSSSNFFV